MLRMEPGRRPAHDCLPRPGVGVTRGALPGVVPTRMMKRGAPLRAPDGSRMATGCLPTAHHCRARDPRTRGRRSAGGSRRDRQGPDRSRSLPVTTKQSQPLRSPNHVRQLPPRDPTATPRARSTTDNVVSMSVFRGFECPVPFLSPKQRERLRKSQRRRRRQPASMGPRCSCSSARSTLGSGNVRACTRLPTSCTWASSTVPSRSMRTCAIDWTYRRMVLRPSPVRRDISHSPCPDCQRQITSRTSIICQLPEAHRHPPARRAPHRRAAGAFGFTLRSLVPGHSAPGVRGGPMTLKNSAPCPRPGGPMRLKMGGPFRLKISARGWSLHPENRTISGCRRHATV